MKKMKMTMDDGVFWVSAVFFLIFDYFPKRRIMLQIVIFELNNFLRFDTQLLN